jgi:hypothetical protein
MKISKIFKVNEMRLEKQKYINEFNLAKQMKKEVYLEDLVPSLQKTHIKLNLGFLNRLLQNASKSNKPHRNQEFAKRIGCPVNKDKKSATTIYGWMMGYRTVSFSKLTKIINLSDYNWKDIETNLISIKVGIRSGEISPIFPIRIDEKMGSIVGHILGDGSIGLRFHSLFYSNSNVELLKEFNKNMRNIVGIGPRIWVQEKSRFEEKTRWLKRVNNLNKIPKGHNVGLFYPKICSDILYALFGIFAEGKNKKITPQIINLDKEFKKGLIRAFFDDEGSVRSDSHTVRFHQDNKKLLKQMIILLKSLGIEPQKVRSYKKKNKLRYYFNITGFREYYRFYHSIGCTSSKKKKEFELLINKVKNSKQFKKKYAL